MRAKEDDTRDSFFFAITVYETTAVGGGGKKSKQCFWEIASVDLSLIFLMESPSWKKGEICVCDHAF